MPKRAAINAPSDHDAASGVRAVNSDHHSTPKPRSARAADVRGPPAAGELGQQISHEKRGEHPSLRRCVPAVLLRHRQNGVGDVHAVDVADDDRQEAARDEDPAPRPVAGGRRLERRRRHTRLARVPLRHYVLDPPGLGGDSVIAEALDPKQHRRAIRVGRNAAYMPRMTSSGCALLIVLVILRGAPAHAEEKSQSQEEQQSKEEREVGSDTSKLAREFTDPLTTLPQIFIQDAYTPANYGTDAQTNRVIARAIIPRIPSFSLFPFVQLVRPTFQLVTVPTGRGSATRTEFGDMQLFDFAVLPWPGRESGLMMGVGPVFVFPTATDKTAGQGSWQVGPGFGAIYKGIPGILLGGLIQNPISFAYTSPDRRPTSMLLIQPILLAYIGRGFYVKSADATWTISWYHHTRDDCCRSASGSATCTRPRGLAADQRLRDRRMDGLSPVRAGGASNDHPIRVDGRLSRVAMVGIAALRIPVPWGALGSRSRRPRRARRSRRRSLARSHPPESPSCTERGSAPGDRARSRCRPAP